VNSDWKTLTNLAAEEVEATLARLPAPLAKQSFDGRTFTFSSTSTTGAVLTMNLQMANEGKVLRGNGKHNGFGARMELQRTD